MVTMVKKGKGDERSALPTMLSLQRTTGAGKSNLSSRAGDRQNKGGLRGKGGSLLIYQ